MQAALFVRNKKKRRPSKTPINEFLPHHVSTKQIKPFPRYNPILAAGLLKDRVTLLTKAVKGQIKPHRTMAKPLLVGTVTQDNSGIATLIEEAKDGMSFITTQIKVNVQKVVESKRSCQESKAAKYSKIPTKLPNGRNAWPGGTDSRASSRRRGGSKNKVGDVSVAAASQAVKDPAAKYNQNGVVNIVLYVGFALLGLGMILTFVGMGEQGFKTKELQLIGPSLIACGILFTVLRIMFCSFNCRNKEPKPLDEKALLSPSLETLAEDRLSTPPHMPRMTEYVTPLREIQDTVRPETALVTDSNNPFSPSHHPPENIQQLLEDEVESDAELGLEVQYIGEDEKGRGTQSPRKSLLSNDGNHHSNIPILDSSFTHSEVLLDPAKLENPMKVEDSLKLEDSTSLKLEDSTSLKLEDPSDG